MMESFNGQFRDEFLNGEIFYALREAKVLIEGWRREYNRVRPHSALGYRPPAPEMIKPLTAGFRSAPTGFNGVWTNMEGGAITVAADQYTFSACQEHAYNVEAAADEIPLHSTSARQQLANSRLWSTVRPVT